MIKIGKILFEIFEKMLGGDLLFVSSVYRHLKQGGGGCYNALNTFLWIRKIIISLLVRVVDGVRGFPYP